MCKKQQTLSNNVLSADTIITKLIYITKLI